MINQRASYRWIEANGKEQCPVCGALFPYIECLGPAFPHSGHPNCQQTLLPYVLEMAMQGKLETRMMEKLPPELRPVFVRELIRRKLENG